MYSCDSHKRYSAFLAISLNAYNGAPLSARAPKDWLVLVCLMCLLQEGGSQVRCPWPYRVSAIEVINPISAIVLNLSILSTGPGPCVVFRVYVLYDCVLCYCCTAFVLYLSLHILHVYIFLCILGGIANTWSLHLHLLSVINLKGKFMLRCKHWTIALKIT